jgi:hypothetical protein
MKTSLVLLVAVFIFIGCDKKEEKPKTNTDYLAGSSSKAWNVTEDSSDDEPDTDPSCKVSSARNADNKIIFFRNGDYEFDRGEATGDECEECCSDLINHYGSWAISSTNTLTMVAMGSIVDGTREEFDQSEELMNAAIQKISETELVLTQDGETITLTPVD